MTTPWLSLRVQPAKCNEVRKWLYSAPFLNLTLVPSPTRIYISVSVSVAIMVLAIVAILFEDSCRRLRVLVQKPLGMWLFLEGGIA